MLVKLIRFEIIKKWKVSKFVLLGYLLIQTLLLIIIGTNSKGSVFEAANMSFKEAVPVILYFVFMSTILVYPFFESLYRFERDISSKQAVFEMMIPAVSWKRLLSKLIPALANALICALIGVVSLILFAIISTGFDSGMISEILMKLKEITISPVELIYAFIYIISGFASIFMLFYFCIVFSKSFSHRNRVAIPIGIMTFILIVSILSYFAIQTEKYPIVNYKVLGMGSGLSETIMDIAVLAIFFIATSFIMEKRIEH